MCHKNIFTVFVVLIACLSYAQDITTSSTYQPSVQDYSRYGPGFPAYCSGYPERPECISFYNNQYSNQPVPVEPDPCFITGGYQPGCQPSQYYLCLPGDPVHNCLPPPIPPALPPVPSCDQPGCVLLPVLPTSMPPVTIGEMVDSFRLPIPTLSVECQYGYSPHCLSIAPLKLFDPTYAVAPSIPDYSIGEQLRYRVNSPYTGYLYVFVADPDGATKLIYPNTYSNQHNYVTTGMSLDFPELGAPYSLAVAPPYGMHKLFYYVFSRSVDVDNLLSVRSHDDLMLILSLEFQVDVHIQTEPMYFGYGETAFNIAY